MRDGTANIAGVQPGAMVHFYIEMLKDGTIALEIMSGDGEPTGKIIEEGITGDEFSKKYKTCSNHKCTLKPRTVDEVAKKMSITRQEMGEQDLKRGDLEGAEEKFERAINLDEKNVRASLGLGMAKMEQGKVDEAMEVFKKLSSENAIYNEPEKHTFNEFGIYLRKNKLYNLAVENYEKAIYISPDDEVLYFNLARGYKENGDVGTAITKLRECVRVIEDKPEGDSDEEKLEQEKILKLVNEHIELYMEAEKLELEKIFQAGSKAEDEGDGKENAKEMQEEPVEEEKAKRKSLEMDVDYTNDADSSDGVVASDEAGDADSVEQDDGGTAEKERQALEELLADDFDKDKEA